MIKFRKYLNKAFFVLNVSIFLFWHETSHIEKFGATDFENDYKK